MQGIRLLAFLVTATVLVHCGNPNTLPSYFKAEPPARYAMGLAAKFDAAEINAENEHVLEQDIYYRRQEAWKRIQQITSLTSSRVGSVPKFLTWYSRDEIAKIFLYVYENVGKSG